MRRRLKRGICSCGSGGDRRGGAVCKKQTGEATADKVVDCRGSCAKGGCDLEGGLRRVCGQGSTAAVDRLRFRLRLVASQSFRWRRSPTQFQFHVIREIFILISPQSEVAGAATTDACVHVCLSLSHSLASYLPSPSPALPLLSINIANNQSGLLLNMQIPGHMAGDGLGC